MMDSERETRIIDDLVDHVRTAGPDVQVQTTPLGTFLFVGEDRMFPFATIISRDDAYDNASRLDRPGVFRLNVGVSPATFRSLVPDAADGEPDRARPDVDYAVLDRFLPHPVYGHMFWLCVLNPGPATLPRLTPLLREAYDLQRARNARRQGRGGPTATSTATATADA